MPIYHRTLSTWISGLARLFHLPGAEAEPRYSRRRSRHDEHGIYEMSMFLACLPHALPVTKVTRLQLFLNRIVIKPMFGVCGAGSPGQYLSI